MESTQQRLAAFVKYTGLSDNQITIRAGLSNGLLGHIIKRGTAFTNETLEKLMAIFPELNVNWLLSGEGEMLKGTYQTSKHLESGLVNEPAAHYEAGHKSKIRLISEIKNVFINTKKENDFYTEFSLPWLNKGDYVAIQVKGEDMFPTLIEGDFIILKKITPEEIQKGQIYLFKLGKQFVLRRIEKLQESLKLIADNEQYEESTLEIEAITNIYQVIQRITKNFNPIDSKYKELIRVYKQLLLAKGVDVDNL